MWGNQNKVVWQCALPELYLADTALRNVYVFRPDFGDPFNTHTSSSIYTDPVEIAPSSVSKIRALLEKHNREGGVGTVKSIHRPIFFNENSADVYSHYLKTEMATLHQNLQNFEGVF